jgi:hypothetical protein
VLDFDGTYISSDSDTGDTSATAVGSMTAFPFFFPNEVEPDMM